MSENYLDTPFAYTALERDLTAALDERDRLIAHYQRREAERQRRRLTWTDLRDFAGMVLALLLFAALVYWGVK